MLFRSDRKSTRLNSSHTIISYAVFCLKKKKKTLSTKPNTGSHAASASRPSRHVRPPAQPLRASHDTVIRICRSSLFFFFFFLNKPAPPKFSPFPHPAPLPI